MTSLCSCCLDCDHLVSQITRGGMPDALDGRKVRVLVAREVGRCDNCRREWTDGSTSRKEGRS